MLDLYQGRWEGKLLEPGDMVICADAKPSIQARRRIHRERPAGAGSAGSSSSTSTSGSARVTYLDAWDVRRGRVIGTHRAKGRDRPFDRLVRQVMTKEPYTLRPPRVLDRRQRL